MSKSYVVIETKMITPSDPHHKCSYKKEAERKHTRTRVEDMKTETLIGWIDVTMACQKTPEARKPRKGCFPKFSRETKALSTL